MKFQELYGTAKFIAPSDVSVESPYFRTTFEVKDLKKAKITICGLGFFMLFINGKKVSDDMLVPANSLFRYRKNAQCKTPSHDIFSYRTYSVEYDLCDYIKDGRNTLVVQLGSGWYGRTGDRDQLVDYFGNVKLCYKLEITDKDGDRTIVSDTNHKWRKSFIGDNCIYLGENQDMREYDESIFDADYDDSGWENAVEADIHECEYDIQHFPTDKVIRTLKTVPVKDFGDYTVYDCGENISGYVVVSCEKSGERIEINHAEELNEDKTLYTVTCAGDRKPQRDIYISDGVHDMHPYFCWHGFRYFSLTNNAKPVEVHVVHSDMNITSHFESDNEMLNWLYETYLRTQLDNMHCGVPSDCPTRERLGYTGDGQLCADAALLMMDGREFYKKWMQDIIDSQCIITGHVNHTTPYQGGGGGIGGWGSAIIHIPYIYYVIYGDDCLIEKHFARMLSFMRYLDSRCKAGFIYAQEPDVWNLGDWGFSVQHEFVIPQNYVNTYFYIRCLKEMCVMAPIVGRGDLVEGYEEKIDISKRAMQGAYFSSQDGNFFGDYQGANCFAVDLGIGDERTYENMYKKYDETREYDTGIFATDIITGMFFEHGDAQLAFDLLTSEKPLSFGNMKNNGATTLWEYMWGEKARTMSHNHPMFGAATKYLFTELLGIKQREGTYGYKDIILDPATVNGLNDYSGYIDVGSGRIGVSVKHGKTNTLYKLEVPEGVKAEFRFEGESYPLKAGVNEFDM